MRLCIYFHTRLSYVQITLNIAKELVFVVLIIHTDYVALMLFFANLIVCYCEAHIKQKCKQTNNLNKFDVFIREMLCIIIPIRSLSHLHCTTS